MGRAAWWVLAGCVCFEAVAGVPDTAPQLSAEQIVEKNVAAKGGLEAWRKIETMSWVGHVETATAAGARLPFMLEMKRPNKTRFAINAPQQVSMRMFDGKQGWKLRSTNSGQPDLKPYSAAETAFALDGQVIEGPLMDYQAKGSSVMLEDIGEIDGSKAYRLGVKLPSGASYHIWIDAQSFLDVKSERESRNAFGKPGMVTKHYRNYRIVNGLQIPFLIENSTKTGKIADRMVIDKVVLNPPLDDRIFSKPNVPGGQQTVMPMGDDAPQMHNRPGGPGLPQPPGRHRPDLGSIPGSGNAQ
jgi:hypothetical protein